MSWPKLETRLTVLPLLLAGPILRRVTPTSVTVWVALLKKATVQLTVRNDKDRNFIPPVGVGSTAAIGTNLHIAAITARVDPPLVEGVVYTYDLTFDFDGGSTRKLLEAATPRAPGAVPADATTFAYPPFTLLPSFSLPPAKLDDLRLIHGSCRKPHGEGWDALSILDSIISDSMGADAAKQRPHQLLLTGDQIYADDVADSLLLMLTDAGDTLLGWDPKEMFLIIPLEGAAFEAKAEDLPPYTRDGPLLKAGFTSDDRRSHLMSLGEFFAMYLFVWSDVLWPGTIPDAQEIKDRIKNADDWTHLSYIARQSTIPDDIKWLLRFKMTLSSVRRALANVPTYMICDDHEVTDDWNMTRRFCETVYDQPLGLRIAQNALVAFAICQSWGNQPEAFEDPPAGSTQPRPPGAKLLFMLSPGVPGDFAKYYFNSQDIQRIVGMHSAFDLRTAEPSNPGGFFRVFHESDSLRYNLTVQGPKHLVIVTDSRTWRSFPDSTPKEGWESHPHLIETTELANQLNTKPPADGLLLVVLTTNIPPTERIRYAAKHPWIVNTGGHSTDTLSELSLSNYVARKRGWSSTQQGIYENDLCDSWEFPSLQFDRMVVQISRLLPNVGGQVLLLSGDVHFSFTSRLAYWSDRTRFIDPDPNGSPPARFVVAQLVASALKNETSKTRNVQDIGYAYAPFIHDDQVAKLIRPDEFYRQGYAGWNFKADTGKILGLVGSFPIELIELTDGPTYGTMLDSSVEVDSNNFPKYHYRLDYLSVTTTGQGVATPPVIPGTSESKQWAKNHAQAANAVRQLKNKGIDFIDAVGRNNLGEIRLSWPATADKHAFHTLWYRDDKGKTVWVRYDVPLDVDHKDYKPIKAKNEP